MWNSCQRACSRI
uniref:Uncharacterized protein n=1 Tax=Anguilla anguilla TaxID=7936 RepID=A0A0E9XVS6_ANGAN